MNKTEATIIRKIMYDIDSLGFYKNTSKSIFKPIKVYRDKYRLRRKIKNLDTNNIILNRQTLIEFIESYNISYDTITIDDISSVVLDDNYILNINSSNNDIIRIVINTKNYTDNIVVHFIRCNGGYTDHSVTCKWSIENVSTEHRAVMMVLAELLRSAIKEYLELYLDVIL